MSLLRLDAQQESEQSEAAIEQGLVGQRAARDDQRLGDRRVAVASGAARARATPDRDRWGR